MAGPDRIASRGPGEGRNVSLEVTLIGFVIAMIDGYDSLMISFVAPLLARGWGLRPTDIGRIFAVGYLGAIVGGVTMGPLADRFGRKPMLTAALALAAVATGLCALATSLEMLLALRFLAGVGLGGALPALSSLTAEHARAGHRSGAVTLMYIGYPMGAVVGGAVTAAFIHAGWQTIFLGAAAACVLALAAAQLLPESLRPQPSGAAARPLAGRVAGAFTDQFAEGRLWAALALWLGLFCMLMLTYFLVSWTPSILVAGGASPRVAALGGVLLNLGGIVGAVLATPVINRFGPYRPVAVMVAVGALFVALFGQKLGSVPLLMLVLFVAGACVIGGQLNFPAMTVELFPRRVRGAGSGWTIGVGRIGSIVGPLAGGALIAAHLGADKLFLLAAVPALAAAGCALAASRLKPRRTCSEDLGEKAESGMDDAPDIAADGSNAPILAEHQRLQTSGARTALPFAVEGQLYLAVPQLAEDVPGQDAQMNAGNSDVDAILYRWADGRFVEHERLPTPGGEDALVFHIGEETYLATAGVRTGSGPYDLNAFARIYRRDSGAWAPVQAIATFAGKQLAHFTFDGRHFLALAQGVTVPGADARHPRQSRILEWNGEGFEDFQVLEGGWGYNWAFFELDGGRYLAYADHTSASLIYRWEDGRFVPFQTIADHGGRAFRFFEADGQAWLAYAQIDGDSTLLRWSGRAFEPHQILGGPGGREFELIATARGLYLARVCFIEGTPTAPKTDLASQIYRWEAGRFELVGTFPTFGGTDASAFTADGQLYLAVSNSLTADVRFRQDSVIYRLDI